MKWWDYAWTIMIKCVVKVMEYIYWFVIWRFVFNHTFIFSWCVCVHLFISVEGLLQFPIMTTRGRRRPIIIPESFSSLITVHTGNDVMWKFTFSCLLCINSCCPWGDGRLKRPGGRSDLSLSISEATRSLSHDPVAALENSPPSHVGGASAPVWILNLPESKWDDW